MLGEGEVRSLLESLAPEFSRERLEPQTPGFDKRVWFLGDHHMLRVARHDLGRRRMGSERRVLNRLSGRLGAIEVPAVVAVSDDGLSDICRRVHGRALHWREWDGVTPRQKAGLAGPMGEAVAVLHDVVTAEEVEGMDLPAPRVLRIDILVGLVGRTGHRRREQLLERILELAQREHRGEVVLLHNDLGLHNLSLDPVTLELRGIFDFADVAAGDPHVDTRYDPRFEAGGAGMLSAYETTRGVALSAQRQALVHAMAALENLSHSLAHEGPELQARRFRWVDSVAGWDPSRYGG